MQIILIITWSRPNDRLFSLTVGDIRVYAPRTLTYLFVLVWFRIGADSPDRRDGPAR